MDSWESNLRAKTTKAVIDELTMLEVQIPVVRSRARVIGTPAEEAIFAELEAEALRLRLLYKSIDTKRHANIVAAELADLQGREKQVQFMIEGWRSAKEADKMLDTRIRICKNLIKERREMEQSRRIGNE